MRINCNSAPRMVLFVLGALVLGLLIGFGLPAPLRVFLMIPFLIVIAVMVYVVLLAPLVFGFEMSDGSLVGGIIYYRGATIFAVLSAAVAVWALTTRSVSPFFIILEAAFLVLFGVYVLLSSSAAAHVEQIKHTEAYEKAVLDELKLRAATLRNTVEQLGGDDEAHAAVRKLTESIRFLSPSEKEEARQLETMMIMKLESLDLTHDADSQLRELELLYRQRKGIY